MSLPPFRSDCTDLDVLHAWADQTYGQIGEGLDNLEKTASAALFGLLAPVLMKVPSRAETTAQEAGLPWVVTPAPARTGLHAFQIEGANMPHALGKRIVMAVMTHGWSMPSTNHHDIQMFFRLLHERNPTPEEIEAELNEGVERPHSIMFWSHRCATEAWQVLGNPDAPESVITPLLTQWSSRRSQWSAMTEIDGAFLFIGHCQFQHPMALGQMSDVVRGALRTVGLEAEASALLARQLPKLPAELFDKKTGAPVKGLERSAALSRLTLLALAEDQGWIGAAMARTVQRIHAAQITPILESFRRDVARIQTCFHASDDPGAPVRHDFNDGRVRLHGGRAVPSIAIETQHQCYHISCEPGLVQIGTSSRRAPLEAASVHPWLRLEQATGGAWQLPPVLTLDDIRNINDVTSATASARCCFEEEIEALRHAPSM